MGGGKTGQCACCKWLVTWLTLVGRCWVAVAMTSEGRLFGSTLIAWGVPAGVTLADGAHLGIPLAVGVRPERVRYRGLFIWAGHLV